MKFIDDVFNVFEQGMKKLSHTYTMYYNKFKEFIFSFITQLPNENLTIFLKNLTFYSGDNSVTSNLLTNVGNINQLEQSEKMKLFNDIFSLCIKLFFQTGKLLISGEKILLVGEINLPPDTSNLPNTISLFFQYNDSYQIQSITAIQAICMWLYAFNKMHAQLVNSGLQEYFMNLTYKSLRFPEENM